MSDSHIISTIVENKPGVLFRTANMFMRRGFNIESISVGPLEQNDLSRMTITVKGDDDTADQAAKQLGKIVDVVDVSQLDSNKSVVRELALMKINAKDTRVRAEIMSYVNIFRSRIVDVTPETITVEITGTPDKIDAFIELASSFGIKEVARTGLTALSRG